VLHDVGNEGPIDYLVMEFLQGDRDLKPGNVILTKLGAKLPDFGLAKPLGATVASGTGSGSASVFAAALTQTMPSVAGYAALRGRSGDND